MILLLDIGNSAVKGAFGQDAALHDAFRLSLPPNADAGAWTDALGPLLENRPLRRIGLVSVVPSLTARIREALARMTPVPAVVLDHRSVLPFGLDYETPMTLGADRLAAAAGAWAMYGQRQDGDTRSVVALDAGTAVTFEVVDRDGVYRGGPILAGPEVVRDALSRGTAQLPAVPLDLPSSPIGRSTQTALQAGLLFPFLDGVAGMLRRIADALGAPPYVVATGGWAPFLCDRLSGIDDLDPHLVLHGVRVLLALQPG